MIPVTQDDLEALAFDNPGVTISLGGRVPTLRLGAVTYGAIPDPLLDRRPELRELPQVGAVLAEMVRAS